MALVNTWSTTTDETLHSPRLDSVRLHLCATAHGQRRAGTHECQRSTDEHAAGGCHPVFRQPLGRSSFRDSEKDRRVSGPGFWVLLVHFLGPPQWILAGATRSGRPSQDCFLHRTGAVAVEGPRFGIL